MTENQGKWDVKKIVGQMELLYAHISEHGFETFEELSKKDPQKAIDEFPKFLYSVLNAGEGFFSGKMCGGPYPGATVPLLNVIGSVYPRLNPQLREKALNQSLRFLDGLNYLNAQNNVRGMHEPHLVGDIFINRCLYWPGYQWAEDLVRGKTFLSELESEILKTDGKNYFLNAKSDFMFTYNLCLEKNSSPYLIRDFKQLCPGLVDRTLDSIAGMIAVQCAYDNFYEQQRVPYQEGVRAELKQYHEELRDDIYKKMKAKKWILLPQNKLRNHDKVVEFLKNE